MEKLRIEDINLMIEEDGTRLWLAKARVPTPDGCVHTIIVSAPYSSDQPISDLLSALHANLIDVLRTLSDIARSELPGA